MRNLEKQFRTGLKDFASRFYKSLVIAFTVFILAILSEATVRIYYSTNDAISKVINSTAIIILMALLFMLMFNVAPRLESVFNTMFGFGKEKN